MLTWDKCHGEGEEQDEQLKEDDEPDVAELESMASRIGGLQGQDQFGCHNRTGNLLS